MEKEKKVKDVDFADSAVPSSARKNVVTMFMIMLGFTFFSASMWVGQQLADGLDFWGFLGSLILGGIILGIYTGLLGYVGAKTGLSLDLLSQRAFGEKGSYLPSDMTSFTQIGWCRSCHVCNSGFQGAARRKHCGTVGTCYSCRRLHDRLCLFWY